MCISLMKWKPEKCIQFHIGGKNKVAVLKLVASIAKFGAADELLETLSRPNDPLITSVGIIGDLSCLC